MLGCCRCATAVTMAAPSLEKKPRIFRISFGRVYPLYVQKAERKKRTKKEVDQIIQWLTGYTAAGLKKQIESLTTELADLRYAYEAQREGANRWKDEVERERRRANDCARYSAAANLRSNRKCSYLA